MVDIMARVIGHALTLAQSPQAASGSVQADRVHFEFDAAWDGLTKRALFWGAGSDEPYVSLVSSGGYAVIPWEVLQERSKIKFGVYGTEPGQTTPRITSTLIKYAVQEGAWSDSIANSGTPTPSLIEQFEAVADAAIADMEAAEARVDAKLTQLGIDAALVYPKKAASGEAVWMDGTVAAPVQGLTVYGKAAQDGVPTPSSPAAISIAGEGGALNLRTAGRNLIPYPYSAGSATVYDVSFAANADGTVNVSGTNTHATDTANFNLFRSATSGFLPNGVYTVSGMPTMGTGLSACALQVRTNDKSGGNAHYYSVPAGGQTFTCTDDATITSVFISVSPGVAVSGVRFRPMIVRGSTSGDYAAYSGSSAALPTPGGLPGIPVSSGGNYADASGQQWLCDTVDMAAGTYTRRCAVLTLDGTQAYTLSNANDFYVALDDLIHAADYSERILCDALATVSYHGKVHTTSNSISGYYDNTGDYPAKIWLYINLSGITTVAALKTYLTSHPITVVYALNAPATEPLTDAQKAALASLRGQKGFTALYSTDASAPGLRAELVIDIPTYIGELLDARLGKVDDNFDTLCMVHNDLVDGSGEKIEYINGYVVIDASPN